MYGITIDLMQLQSCRLIPGSCACWHRSLSHYKTNLDTSIKLPEFYNYNCAWEEMAFVGSKSFREMLERRCRDFDADWQTSLSTVEAESSEPTKWGECTCWKRLVRICETDEQRRRCDFGPPESTTGSWRTHPCQGRVSMGKPRYIDLQKTYKPPKICHWI